jgi:hypothetical protein
MICLSFARMEALRAVQNAAFVRSSAPFELRFPSAITACYANMNMLKSSFPMIEAKA